MRLVRPVAILLLLGGCSSPYGYALDSDDYPIEEPPCCNSSQLILTAEEYIEPSLEGVPAEAYFDPLLDGESTGAAQGNQSEEWW